MFHFFGAKSFHRCYLSLGLGKPHQMCKLLKSILFIWCCTNSVNPEAKHSLHLSTPAHRSRTRIARIQPLTPIITFDRILLKGNSRWENIRLFLLSNLRIETLGWGETLECLPFCVRHLPLSDVCGGRQGEEEQGQEGRWRVHQDQELGGLCPLLLPVMRFVLISSLWCKIFWIASAPVKMEIADCWTKKISERAPPRFQQQWLQLWELDQHWERRRRGDGKGAEVAPDEWVRFQFRCQYDMDD